MIKVSSTLPPGVPASTSRALEGASTQSFSDVLTKATASTTSGQLTVGKVTYNREQIKSFLDKKPSVAVVAQGAHNLGMTNDQIATALQLGSMSSKDQIAMMDGLDSWVRDSSHGYGWNTNGTLMRLPNGSRYVASGEGAMVYDTPLSKVSSGYSPTGSDGTAADLPGSNLVSGNREGGRSVATGLGQTSWTPELRYFTGASQGASSLAVKGTVYSKQQLQDFYARGGDDYSWLRGQGVTNPSDIRALSLQARDIAGNAPQGEAALAYYYDRAAVDSAGAKTDFATWKQQLNDIDQRAMRMGVYLQQDTKLV